MDERAKKNFVWQQGIRDADAATCSRQYHALMLQPRLVGILVVLGLIFQNGPFFLALSAVLWWNVAVPARNPFDALYNRVVASPKGLPPVAPAAAPRRFAQGMAATFMLAVGLCLLFDWRLAAWILEGLLTAALVALIFGKFCLGSYLFHLLRGDRAFANRTLPWARE